MRMLLVTDAELAGWAKELPMPTVKTTNNTASKNGFPLWYLEFKNPNLIKYAD